MRKIRIKRRLSIPKISSMVPILKRKSDQPFLDSILHERKNKTARLDDLKKKDKINVIDIPSIVEAEPAIVVFEDGTEAHPWLVSDSWKLQKVGSGIDGWNRDHYYKQVANIDWAEHENEFFVPLCWYPSGGMIDEDVVKFVGNYNGDNYTINNLKINAPGNEVGLFAEINGTTDIGSGVIQKIHLRNIHFKGQARCGGIAGSVIQLAGTQPPSIICCSVEGIIDGYCEVGGIAGSVFNSSIRDCFTNISMTAEYYGVGGIAGSVDTFRDFLNNYSVGSIVSTSGSVGGCIGQAYAGTYVNCYAACLVAGTTSVGGFSGSKTISNQTDCFFDSEVAGTTNSANGTPKTTVEMKQQATFTNWDFVNVWNITQDTTYPYLRDNTQDPLPI